MFKVGQVVCLSEFGLGYWAETHPPLVRPRRFYVVKGIGGEKSFPLLQVAEVTPTGERMVVDYHEGFPADFSPAWFVAIEERAA